MDVADPVVWRTEAAKDREIIQLSPLSPCSAEKSSFKLVCNLKKASERLTVVCPLI
jgi:hypothetical protein